MAVTVDEATCLEIARLLINFSIPEDVEDSSIEGLTDSQTCNFYLLLVAICHQTQSLMGFVDGEKKRGWDYLRLKLLKACSVDQTLLSISNWREFSAESLTLILSDPESGDTLTDTERRVALIHNLAVVFNQNGWQDATDLFSKSSGDAKQVIVSLAQTEAFNDPVRKKSYFYLGLIRNSGAYDLSNYKAIGAPVDYHEVRGHVRLGTVTLAPELRRKLLAGRAVSCEEDVAIRSSVHQAIELISDGLSISPMRLHYLFWNLFRNICLRKNPNCRTDTDGLPDRYANFSKSGCPFQQVCCSIDGDKILEHSFVTDWY